MDFLASAENRLFVLKLMSHLCSISIIYSLSKLQDSNTILIGIFLVIIIELNNYLRCGFFLYPKRENGNGFMRSKYIGNNEFTYYFSFCITTLINGYLNYKLMKFGTEANNVILISEIIISNSKINGFALIFNFATYVASYYMNKLNILEPVSNYIMTGIIVFLFRNIAVEKTRAEKLNEELTAANLKLEEYSKQIEGLTITRERTRIAQELHDSMGHSLVALKMNIEYCSNIMDSDSEKAKSVMTNTQGLVKECMNNLRKVVTLLKEDQKPDTLRDSINELFEKFKEANSVRLILDMEDKAEGVNPDIKNSIYKTVREAVTNGLKHGNATVFKIDIFIKEKNIFLTIKNNGMACRNMTKSNGIKGIENRIGGLGGKLEFLTEPEYPYGLQAVIPIV